MNAEEAAQSLAAIRETQTRAIRSQPWFPTWYTVGVGAFVTGVQAVTEPGTPTSVTVAGSGVLVTALVVLVVLLVRTRRMARKIEDGA